MFWTQHLPPLVLNSIDLSCKEAWSCFFFLFFYCYLWYKAVKLSNCNLWQRTWNHVFFHNRSSWETIFSKSTEVVTPEQLQCCRRIVQLCKHCLLVVYKYSSDSRGSPTGISPYWDDTRYTFQYSLPKL